MTRKVLVLILVLVVVIPALGQQKRETENVFLITMDGFRWQEMFSGADSLLITNKTYVEDTTSLKEKFWAKTPAERRTKLMPFFWSEIATKGQLYGNRKLGNLVNCSNKMWFSFPGYNEILSGFADDERITSNDKINNPNKTVLEFLNADQRFKNRVAAFGSWDVFPFIVNEARSGIPVNAGFEPVAEAQASEKEKLLNQLMMEISGPFNEVRLDAFTHHYAFEYLQKNKPKVLYISYGETDDYAHEGKYDHYLKSAWQTDQFISELWSWAQSDPAYRDKTTFIVTTDHGRGVNPLDSWRSHNKDVKDSDQIWIAVLGPDTPSLGEVKSAAQLYQNQVASTLAVLLGVDYKNEKPPGKPIASAIKK